MNSLVPSSIRARLLVLLLAGAPGLLFLQGCTDLDESPVSSITPDRFYGTEEEVLGGLASVYAQLRNTLPGTAGTYWELSQVPSDELIVPTRGSDWFDNGQWLELHRQTWGSNTVSALNFMDRHWVQAFTGVTRANVLLDALESVAVPDEELIRAELRTLRAFFYYMLMDMFGGVPIVETTEIAARPRATRAEVFEFIAAELKAARDILPAAWPSTQHGRMTSGAANAILASLYLNAGVFTRDQGISTSSYNSCTTVTVGGGNACDAAIEAANRILNSGEYTLAADWRSNHSVENHTSPENILVVKHLNEDGLGWGILMTTLHYNQFSPTPWNGFSAEAEAYNSFDADDDRLGGFLVGPQVNLDTGQPAVDRQGNPLSFSVQIENPEAATEAEGARIFKWTPDPNRVAQHMTNDFAYFRLAEIYLIQAEALNETGATGTAVGLVNTVRARAFEPDEPLNPGIGQAALRDAILQERLFEFFFEAKRRQDQIRYGTYTSAWQHKPAAPDHVVLMPIPQQQLNANPELTQNPGY